MDSVLSKYYRAMERLCIYPKDVQIVTGRSERYGRKLISQIKKKFEKENHQLVSVEEFCNYTGLEKASVLQLIKY